MPLFRLRTQNGFLTSCVLKSTNYRKFIETIICFPYNGIVRKKKEVIIMQVEIKIDSSYIDPKVIILTASMTEDVSNIVKKLSEDASQIISGHKKTLIQTPQKIFMLAVSAVLIGGNWLLFSIILFF